MPFKPGKSGNPKGRPLKGFSITETIQAMMKVKPEIKKALGSNIIEQALQGDKPSQKLIWQYMDGMPLQKIEAELEGDLVIKQVTYKEKKK